MDYKAESLRLHKEKKGKIETVSKIPVETKDDLSVAYTPGVAEVSRVVGEDPALAYEYTIKANTVAVVSDGSSVLGLGNIGPEGALPVMEGKALLFKEFAGVDAFPICLDTQDPDEIIETVVRIAPTFGGINLEDIGAPNCFYIEEALKKRLDIPVFHDDQHGTAIVVLAGLINSLRLRSESPSLSETELRRTKVVINGAGAAGVAITKILAKYTFGKITICDSKGVIHTGRTDLNETKQELLTLTSPAPLENKSAGLTEALVGADVFIGVSKANLVTKEMVESMASRPIIFAMANPDPEIMPDVAKKAGAFIVATGRSDFPNQVNNVLAFPGIFRGALDNRVSKITDDMKVAAAEALASHVAEPTVDNILPDPLDKTVAGTIAAVIK